MARHFLPLAWDKLCRSNLLRYCKGIASSQKMFLVMTDSRISLIKLSGYYYPLIQPNSYRTVPLQLEICIQILAIFDLIQDKIYGFIIESDFLNSGMSRQ